MRAPSSHFLRILATLVGSMACLALAAAPLAAQAETLSLAPDEVPAVFAAGAVVCDEDGNVLWGVNENVSVPMASTTKVMTAVLAIESGLSLDTTYTVSELAAENESTVVGYEAGEVVTLGDMLKIMMVLSAGDAAVGISECVSGSQEAFIDLMNQRAQELGLTGTHYSRPDGYIDADNYTTPVDEVTLARYAMSLPLFRTLVGSTSVTIPVGGVTKTYHNSDQLLDYYPGMQGIKTGFTYGAGYCFVGCAQRGGVTIYTCVLGDEEEEYRVSDTIALLDWAFDHYSSTTVITDSDQLSAFGVLTSGALFGRSVLTAPVSSVGLRGADGEVQVSTQSTEAEQVYPGSVVGVIEAASATGSVAREVLASEADTPTQTFGPFVSQLFYEGCG